MNSILGDGGLYIGSGLLIVILLVVVLVLILR